MPLQVAFFTKQLGLSGAIKTQMLNISMDPFYFPGDSKTKLQPKG